MSTDARAESAASVSPAGSGAPVGPASQAHAVGRATVPGEAGTTRYVRPPGMPAPPLSPQELPGAVPAVASGPPRASVAEAVRAARQTVSSAAARGPRRARLQLKRIDPWSVMKFSFAVSIVLFIVMIVATTVLYVALDAMGVFDSVNETLGSLIGGGEGSFDFKITAKGVIGVAALLGVVNMVLFTALSTLGAFIYNVCADLVGGIELTLSEKD
jgi:Transmembrane domain of unknown function (DUF3566).